MKMATTIREALGISQQQLSAFIGGHRSLLTRAEKGERSLTAEATLNLVTLYKLHLDRETTEQTIDAPTFEILEAWSLHARSCRHKAAILNQKLQLAKTSYAKAARLKNFVIRLAAAEGLNLTPKQQRWIEQRLYEADKKIVATNHGKQKDLTLAIAALEAEAAIYEQALGG